MRTHTDMPEPRKHNHRERDRLLLAVARVLEGREDSMYPCPEDFGN